jgi:hypothetical protein
MKNGNIYLTNAIELTNNGLDVRFDEIRDDKHDGSYVLVDAHQVEDIELKEY